jgi:tetratricopeptide (TPR) repeat protein
LTSSPQIFDKAAAIDALRKRIAIHPRDFEAHLQLGILLNEEEDTDGAVRHLIAARNLLPEYSAFPNPRKELAAIYEKQGDEAAMLRELEALMNVYQHGFEPCYRLAQAAYRQNDYDRAVYYLERAIAVDPYHEKPHRTIAEIAMKRADSETAIREYKVLLKLEAKDPVRAYTDLAEAYLAGGKKAEAKETVISALEIAPTYERAQNILLEAIQQ